MLRFHGENAVRLNRAAEKFGSRAEAIAVVLRYADGKLFKW